MLNRVDTKYVMPCSLLTRFLEQLTEDYLILVAQGQRSHSYQTLYFDTPSWAMYLMHHNGRGTRVKVRQRHYLGSGAAYWEVKRRTNRQRTLKDRFPLPAAGLASFPEPSLGIDPCHGAELVPRTWTFFERLTLVNLERRERVTVDSQLSFCKAERDPIFQQWPQTTEFRRPRHPACIVEIKRGAAREPSPAAQALRSLHLMPASFSKYCIGSALLWPQLKQNRFKPTLRTLGDLSE